ncbi:MAG: TIGR02530 family flagellar biosynthesis protein [Candidatus Eisenbacteria bacterium]
MNGIQGVGPPIAPRGAAPSPGGPVDKEFHAEFDEALRKHDLKFSRHALDRLRTRNVSLGSTEVERLGSAVAQAGRKGARESLVLLDELAFVVSVRNRTVITALQGKQSGVFTSIDSAVIA